MIESRTPASIGAVLYISFPKSQAGTTYEIHKVSDGPGFVTEETEVIVNYLGQFDQSLGPFQLAPERFGAYRSPASRRSHPLIVNAYVAQGQLHVDWAYSRELHEDDTITALADTFRRAASEAARSR